MTTNVPMPGLEGPPDRQPGQPRRRGGGRRVKFPEHPVEVTWLDIHGDGTEVPRTGHIWAQAEAIGGRGTCVWAIPEGEALPVLVTTVGTRHRVGRGTMLRWRPDGGRFVDKGERYRETSPRSPSARHRGPIAARSISGAPTTAVGVTEMENYLRTIAAIAADQKASER